MSFLNRLNRIFGRSRACAEPPQTRGAAERDVSGPAAIEDGAETDNVETHNVETYNVFLSSLDRLTADDLAPAPAKKKKSSDTVSLVIRYAALAICVTVFAVSSVYVVQTLIRYRHESDYYDQLAGEFNINSVAEYKSAVLLSPVSKQSTITPDFTTSLTLDGKNYSTTIETNKNTERVNVAKAMLNSLYKRNSDLFGWIYIPDTNINYAVTHLPSDPENAYYLNHNFDKNPNQCGTIFVDFRCGASLSQNRNTIIYGHHMSDGTMFNDIDKFTNEAYYKANRHIEIYTFEGIFVYEIFAIYGTNMYYKYITTDFASSEDFVSFCNEMKSNSKFDAGDIEFNENSKIITLSTCDNKTVAGRITLQAVLVDILS